MTFPDFYKSVVDACPEARVDGLVWKPGESRTNYLGRWLRNGHRWIEDDVRAICLRHWMGLMPKYHGVHRVENIGVTFEVWSRYGEADWGTHPTPEEAVGEYLKARKG